MKLPLTLYDALTAATIPTNRAKAVVDAWEADVENLASKSDLQQTETNLKASISELGSAIREQGVELRALIKEQSAELRALIKEQGSELRSSISGLESQNKILRWQFGLIFICVAVPILKMGLELVARSA
ncbi:DUF1640 domain-containing protein [Pseudomonas gingeri]|uniref:DUF1640 domain-containing protein n=1 Tax=Pseudomonas gingeri TaxID=117681 RepID=A0A7Y8C2A9_9PSED|nr:DUF1640 domain-containing protein [Pseudomonas gingeri]NWB96424.1 DUF1640 domain-containing protein [Pseudomonas gingeri]NWD77721.1 DUF1640 domain-containing protein [Pseudomonas gingeri]